MKFQIFCFFCDVLNYLFSILHYQKFNLKIKNSTWWSLIKSTFSMANCRSRISCSTKYDCPLMYLKTNLATKKILQPRKSFESDVWLVQSETSYSKLTLVGRPEPSYEKLTKYRNKTNTQCL